MSDEVVCPVCEDPVFAQTLPEFQMHVEKCIRKQLEGEESSDEEVDVEGDSYEWCGMKRVRVTSLLKSQGRLGALGTLVKKGNEEANVEVCVLQEDEEGFGPPQYFMEDLAKLSHNSAKSVTAMKEENSSNHSKWLEPSSCSSSSSSSSHNVTSSFSSSLHGVSPLNNVLLRGSEPGSCSERNEAWDNGLRVNSEDSKPQLCRLGGTDVCPPGEGEPEFVATLDTLKGRKQREELATNTANCSYERKSDGENVDIEEAFGECGRTTREDNRNGSVVEALQMRIQELQDRDTFICHICHGPYVAPVTSIVCWHVHCENCWLQALCSQKLCPQCKVFVSPSQLRRVYL